MGSVVDYFHAQPEDVRRFIFKVFNEVGYDERWHTESLLQEHLCDGYTKEQIHQLWYAAVRMTTHIGDAAFAGAPWTRASFALP